MNSFEQLNQDCKQVLETWIRASTPGKETSRNTVAVGIVVLDHLRRVCPTTKDEAISPLGEIKGARSGLRTILGRYDIPSTYLKEVTTRQAHPAGQRLFEQLEWGGKLQSLSNHERDVLLMELIGLLKNLATTQLTRKPLEVNIDRRQSPTAWISLIVEAAKNQSGGIVEQHLVGAKLERRFDTVEVPNHPAHAADRQTERQGDFTLARLVYHVTASPSLSVVEKCLVNVREGMHPILLVRKGKAEDKARAFAEEIGIENELTILAIEDFVAINIIELAIAEHKEFHTILRDIIQLYNKRLMEVETDLSLQIALH